MKIIMKGREMINLENVRKKYCKVQICIMISVCLLILFFLAAMLELRDMNQQVLRSFYVAHIPAFLVFGILTITICSVILHNIPARYCGYAVALLFDIFLIMYIILSCLNIPDRCIQAWAENRADLSDSVESAAYELSYPYQLGEILSFGEQNTAKQFCVTGFDFEPTHTWTVGKYAKMCFDLNKEHGDLLLQFDYNVYAPPQMVYLFVNGHEIDNFYAEGPGNREVGIPKEYIPQNELKLEFAFPNAVSPQSRGESADLRVLSLCMNNLCISDSK